MWAYLFCLSFVLTGAVIQEFTLYQSSNEHEGNNFTFREHLPDASCRIFENVTRICHTAPVFTYTMTGYAGSTTIYRNETCETISTSIARSIRFTGNKDTEVDGLSLYSARYLAGREIYVDQSPFAGINEIISGVGWTGPSNWTLFEGKNFDGNHACLPGTHIVGRASFVQDIWLYLRLTTVGSLLKGCLTTVTPGMRADLQRQAGTAQP